MSTLTQRRQQQPVTWPAGVRPVRLGPMSLRIETRALVVTTILAILAIAVGVYSLTVGTAGLGLTDLREVIAGDAPEATTRILVGWRMPRVVFALIAGAGLAIAGAVFQSITRNPLGSPDIIGFSSGAYTGALLVALFATGSATGRSLGALIGGLATGVLVYALAWRRGVSGMRIIIVGIGVSLFLGAFNTWVLTTMRLEDALSAATWGSGNLNDITWTHTIPVFICLAIGLPAAIWLATDMRMLEMGDDAGRGLGVRAEPVRVLLLLIGVALVAAVTAAAGPIAFVALAAPQLAMRLAGTSSVRVLPSAAMGALLLAVSDLLARTIIAPNQLPVGVVTLCLGGAYLVWLLATYGRKSRA